MGRADKYNLFFAFFLLAVCIDDIFPVVLNIYFVTAQGKREDTLLKSVTKKRAAQAYQVLRRTAKEMELQMSLVTKKEDNSLFI